MKHRSQHNPHLQGNSKKYFPGLLSCFPQNKHIEFLTFNNKSLKLNLLLTRHFH